jgi:recombination protein RecT
LSINQNLGHAYIIPYKEKKQNDQGQWVESCVAQFQIGWKGIVQLAQRSGQYKAINVIEVHENQFKKYNQLTEELEADFSIDGTGEIVGYVAYFSLINGFEKTVYWSKTKVEQHAQKFSKTYSNPKGVWKQDFDAMAKKTVLKNTLSKWGVLSIEMTTAVQVDQAVIKDAETLDVDYVDEGKEVLKPTLAENDLLDVVEGLKKGNILFVDIQNEYELTDEQVKELENVEVEN